MNKRDTTPDWEFFLNDLDPATDPPAVPLRLRCHALARTARALWIYRRHGWQRAHRHLQQIRPGPRAFVSTAISPETAVRLARREIFFSQLVVRALMPDGLCLPRSFALTAYLNAIGLKAQVTLARALTPAVPRNTFHSWTELHGTVLNDNPDVLLGYAVLHRVPS